MTYVSNCDTRFVMLFEFQFIVKIMIFKCQLTSIDPWATKVFPPVGKHC